MYNITVLIDNQGIINNNKQIKKLIKRREKNNISNSDSSTPLAERPTSLTTATERLVISGSLMISLINCLPL